jgi:hypothetical protein
MLCKRINWRKCSFSKTRFCRTRWKKNIAECRVNIFGSALPKNIYLKSLKLFFINIMLTVQKPCIQIISTFRFWAHMPWIQMCVIHEKIKKIAVWILGHSARDSNAMHLKYGPVSGWCNSGDLNFCYTQLCNDYGIRVMVAKIKIH